MSDVDLTVGAGEFVCLLGPSGCGKSTLMNLVAGFVPAAAGLATIGGVPVDGPGMDRGVVFQSTEALFPWLTVQENVEYGPRMRGVGQASAPMPRVIISIWWVSAMPPAGFPGNCRAACGNEPRSRGFWSTSPRSC